MENKEPVPEIITGGISIDDRGSLKYQNNIDFSKIKRKYIVKNHNNNFIRAFHAHKYEKKWVEVLQGTARIVLFKVKDWANGELVGPIYSFFLTDQKSEVLYIPEGFANGYINYYNNTIIQFYSSSTLEESKNDDYRYDWDINNTGKYWDTKNYR